MAKQNNDSNEMKELYEMYESTKAKGDNAPDEKEDTHISQSRKMFLVDKSTIIISATVLCLIAIICGWYLQSLILMAPHVLTLLILLLLILFFSVAVWNFRTILLNIKETDKTIEELRREISELKKEKESSDNNDHSSQE